MDFSLLTELEDFRSPLSKSSLNAVLTKDTDDDDDDSGLDIQPVTIKEEIEFMQTQNPEELYELAWKTPSKEIKDEDDEYYSDCEYSCESDEYYSDEEISDSELVFIPTKVPPMKFKFTEDGSFMPDGNQLKKPSMLERTSRFISKNLLFNLRRNVQRMLLDKEPEVDETVEDFIETSEEQPKTTTTKVMEKQTNEAAVQIWEDDIDILEDEQVTEEELQLMRMNNYHPTIEIYLLSGLNRYNVNFNIEHSFEGVLITAKISDASKSTVCILISDDRDKTFQKLIRSRKAEMANRTPKDLVIHLYGLRLANLNIEACNSNIFIKIPNEAWKKLLIKIKDYYPILRKTLKNYKIRLAPENGVKISAVLRGGLSLGNTKVRCTYRRSPEIEFEVNAQPVAVSIWDGKTSEHKLLDEDSSLKTLKTNDGEHKSIKIRLNNLKLGDVSLVSARKKTDGGKITIVLKILAKTSVKFEAFDDNSRADFDITPIKTNEVKYPPWEFFDLPTVHIKLSHGLRLDRNSRFDFIRNKDLIQLVQLRITETKEHPIKIILSDTEDKEEHTFLKNKELQPREIRIDLKNDIKIKQVPVTVFQTNHWRKSPSETILTMDVTQLSFENMRLHIEDGFTSKFQVSTDQGIADQPKEQRLIVFRMDDIFNSDIFKMVDVHGFHNPRGVHITTFHVRLAVKNQKTIVIRIIDEVHVLENIVDCVNNRIKYDYYLSGTKDLDDSNLTIFLKDISLENVALRTKKPDGDNDNKNISLAVIVTRRHPIKVLLSNDLKIIEYIYGATARITDEPTRKDLIYTDLSSTPKVVILKVSNGLTLKDIDFNWDEIHCFVYDNLKQQITICVADPNSAKIILNVTGSNLKMKLVSDETSTEESIKTIDLFLPFQVIEGRRSKTEQYTIFELDVYCNSPIIINMMHGDDVLKKKIRVSLNVNQESRRTREKYNNKYKRLKSAIKSELNARYEKQNEYCISRIVDIKFRKLPIEKQLEKLTEDATENICKLQPFLTTNPEGKPSEAIFTYSDILEIEEGYFLKTQAPTLKYKHDEDFYDNLKNGLLQLKSEDARCGILTGKQPSKYIDDVDIILAEIEQLKPTPRNFKFEIDKTCFSFEDEALIKAALERMENKNIVTPILKETSKCKEEPTEEQLHHLTSQYKQLKGKLLGSSMPEKEGSVIKPRRRKKKIDKTIGEHYCEYFDEFGVMNIHEETSSDIERGIADAFKYYTELIPVTSREAGMPNLTIECDEDKDSPDSPTGPEHISGRSQEKEVPVLQIAHQNVPESLGEASGTQISYKVEIVPAESVAGTSVSMPTTSEEVPITQRTNASRVQYCKCEYCEQRTTGKNHLLNHMKNHNQLRRVPDYFCLFCGRGFKTNGWLQKHVDDRHIDKVAVYTLLNIEILPLNI